MEDKYFEIEGLKEVEDALKTLATKDMSNILRTYNRTALKNYALNDLMSQLPYSPDSLKNIRIVAGKGNKTSVLVGPTSDSYWLRFAEGGTKDRYTKTGAYRGAIFPNRRIEPILDRSATQIIDYTAKNYGEEINKILEKKLKRIKKK